VSQDKKREGERSNGGAKPAVSTVVGVPALPADEGRAPRAGPTRERAPGSPGGASGVPRPATSPATETPPLSSDQFRGLTRYGGLAHNRSGGPPEPDEPPTRATLAQKKGIAARPNSTAEGLAVGAGTTGAMAKRGVAQASPRGEGVSRTASVPKGASLPRDPFPAADPFPAEEISSSLLVPDDSGDAPAANVEELSGSLLLEEPGDGGVPFVGSNANAHVPAAHRALLGLPELPKSTPGPQIPEEPAPADPEEPAMLPAELPTLPQSAFASEPIPRVAGDVKVTTLPHGPLAGAIDTFRRASRWLDATVLGPRASTDRRPSWFLPAVAVSGLAIGIAVVALSMSIMRKRNDTAAGPAATLPSASVAPSALRSPASTFSAPTSPAPSRALAPCVVSGTAHVLAPSAIVAAGVEVRVLGDDVAIGFAPTDHQALGVGLDPATLTASRTATARSMDPIRRVTPLGAGTGSLALAVDVDRKNDPVHGRRTVPFERPIQLGAANGSLVWTHPGGPVAGKLWPLEGDSSVDALRTASEGSRGDSTTAIAFRRGGIVGFGTATGSAVLISKGDLGHVDGLGGAVGSPAVAMNDGFAVVAWSDRPSPGDPWRLRWVRFKAGEAASEPNTFTPPAGGKGEQAMSPGLAAIPGRRLLLIWTEGPTSRHDVRGLTLSEDGTTIGAPMNISSEGVNAGQGQAGVTANGKGLVAFLESTDDGFQVLATPISCGM
jgi:hypothetical protein